jgi:hypothetical protein
MNMLDQATIIILGFVCLLTALILAESLVLKTERNKLKNLIKQNNAYKWWKN